MTDGVVENDRQELRALRRGDPPPTADTRAAAWERWAFDNLLATLNVGPHPDEQVNALITGYAVLAATSSREHADGGFVDMVAVVRGVLDALRHVGALPKGSPS